MTLTGLQTVSQGKIQLDGGTLTDTSGITLGASSNNGFITGFGTIAAAISHSGSGSGSTIVASGGTLDITGNVGSSTNGLQIASGATLRLDGTVASGDVVTFNSTATGTVLDLTSSSISGNPLGGFSGTIAGLNVGSSTTTSTTNEIDLASIAPAALRRRASMRRPMSSR